MGLMACGEREQPRVAKAPSASLRLVALTDLSGFLEPCGCQSKPLGGIDKAAAKLAALRSERVPVLFVAAGDLLFGPKPEGASSNEDAATQEVWKAETLVEILNQLGLAAAAPGARDLAYGAETQQRLAGMSKFSWLPGQPASGEHPESLAGTLVRAGDVPVGVLGVSTFVGAERELPTERLRGLTTRAQAEIERLRAQGARIVVGLISSDQRSGRRLSSSLRGLDFVVQGGLDDQSTPVPSRVGHGALFRAGRQGQGMLVVDVYLDGAAAFVDVSDWTRRETSGALRRQVDDLAKRIGDWERDKSADVASVNEQKRRLSELRDELARAERVQSPSGNAFNARYEALTVEQRGEAGIAGIVDGYDARVNEHNKRAFADRLPPPLQPGAAGYVGSGKCQSCHEEAFAWWTRHGHGRAYTTLEKLHKQYNLSCVACHVTGYEQPGGSSLVHNEGLIHVGCESCHGPGSLHVAKPSAVATQPVASPAESSCKKCHTPEHSDLFEYKTYVARLRAPGHGLPTGAAGQATQ